MTVTPSPQSVVVPKFGDIVENGWASDDNPTRRGFFVREFKRTGKLNPGRTWEITDGKGKFWEFKPADIGERLSVSASPAPSSLAGGEVREKVAGVVECFAMDAGDVIGDPYGYAEAILAALSPEAPALNTIGCAELEVGRAVYERIEKLIDTTTGPEAEELSYLAHLAASVEEVGGYDGPEAPAEGAGGREEIARIIDPAAFLFAADELMKGDPSQFNALSKADRILALRARSSAPAEGAGEDDNLLHDSYIAMRDAMKLIDADEGPGRVHSNALQALAGCRHRIEVRTSAQYALRARSSAPEAREEALGNLLAVIHGDGGHRALEVGTKQAALEAEKIVANLLSSAPEAREGYPSGAWGCVARLSDNTPWEAFAATEDQPDPAGAWSEIISLYTHPAAPSADKLREVLIDLTSWFTKPVQGQNGMVWVIRAGEMGADDALNAALAALKAERA